MNEDRRALRSTALASVALTLGVLSLVTQRLAERVIAAYLWSGRSDRDAYRALQQYPVEVDEVVVAVIQLDRGVWVMALSALTVTLAALILIPRRTISWRLSVIALILSLLAVCAQWDFMEYRRWSRLEVRSIAKAPQN